MRLTRPVPGIVHRMATYFHYLGVGATGMLAGATCALAAGSVAQTLVARGAARFVAEAGLGGAVAVDADWGDTDRYVAAIGAALAGRPAVDLCVLWLHGSAWPALPGLAELLGRGPCRMVHVLGSSSGDPRAEAESARRLFEAHAAITYHSVTLGSVAEGGGRRWLTHAEISAGVLQCVERGSDIVVGEVGY